MHPLFHGASLCSIIAAFFLVGCSENRPVASDPATLTTPAHSRPAIDFPSEPPQPPTISERAPAPEPEPPTDPAAIERRFFAAPNDPEARIAAIRELAAVPPAAALSLLNRLFPVERREDVKSEMLAALGDLDHSLDRDNQLALCTKALAPTQPTRIRYLAVYTLADLKDPRAHAMLTTLKSDADKEIRAAAAQVLSELSE